jgi:hypothetical protein
MSLFAEVLHENELKQQRCRQKCPEIVRAIVAAALVDRMCLGRVEECLRKAEQCETIGHDAKLPFAFGLGALRSHWRHG